MFDDDRVAIAKRLTLDHFASMIRALESAGLGDEEWTGRMRLCHESVSWELAQDADGPPPGLVRDLRLVPS